MTGLQEHGFMVIEAAFAVDETAKIGQAYDDVFASLPDAQIKRGSTSDRFGGLAALEPFRRIYLHEPLIEIASAYIGGPIKLSSFHARTLQPRTPAPALHQDVQPDTDGDPLVGFIFMVDAFQAENGATRFIPASRRFSRPPVDAAEQHACGPAGSLLIFDGATWHEHGANRTDVPRRSIQGYFIRRDHTGAVRWSDALSREQVEQLPHDARRLLRL